MTNEELGHAAVLLPEWRWMPGMLDGASGWRWDGISFVEQRARHPQAGNCISGVPAHWPDLDDAATTGCLLAMIGPWLRQLLPPRWEGEPWKIFVRDPAGGMRANGWVQGLTLGGACIAAAKIIGEWPGRAA